MEHKQSPFIEESEISNYPQIRQLKTHLIGHPGIIAGGCFKSLFSGKKLHDVDMFFRCPADFHAAVSFFKDSKDEYDAMVIDSPVMHITNCFLDNPEAFPSEIMGGKFESMDIRHAYLYGKWVGLEKEE